jgi:DNA repair exonuclease SbcCD nuclease subunit
MRTVNALQPLRHVPGVHVYSQPALHDLGEVVVACLPWVSPARLVASMNGDVDRDQVNEHAARLLVKVADGLVDPRIKPTATVLLLHGSISGASLPTGISTDDLREPVIDVHLLDELGFEAFIASHIHVPQLFDRDQGWKEPGAAVSSMAGFYTGSPMPLNFGETGVPHGCWILDVDGNGTRAEFVPIESRPLASIEWDYTDEAQARWLDTAVGHPSLIDPALISDAIVKLRIRATSAGQRRLDLSGVRRSLLEAGAHTVKIEVDTVREQRSRVEGVTDELDPLEAFDAWAAASDLVDTVSTTSAREQMEADLEQVGA